MHKTKKIFTKVLSGNVRVLAGLVLFFFISCVLSFSGFASERDDVFETVCAALIEKAPLYKIQELEKKFKGRNMTGMGYFLSITKDVDGNTIVNLSTKKNLALPSSVNIAIFLRTYKAKQKFSFKKGWRLRFVGAFKEVRMSTIVLTEGIIK